MPKLTRRDMYHQLRTIRNVQRKRIKRVAVTTKGIPPKSILGTEIAMLDAFAKQLEVILAEWREHFYTGASA